MKQLSVRLQTIANLIPKNQVVADVGCDHGKILEYALRHKDAIFVYGSDISAKSVQKTTQLLTNKKFDNFVTLQSDGFEQYNIADKANITVAVIAGMGGREIIHILQELLQAKEQFGALQKMILQPQNSTKSLRVFLQENNFKIEYDKKIKDKHMFYDVLSVVPFETQKQTLTMQELEFGITNLQQKSKDFDLFLQLQLKQVQKVLEKTKQQQTSQEMQEKQQMIVKLLEK